MAERTVRFGVFEVDLDRAELRKQGLRVRLQEQPFQVLAALLSSPGEVVTREELIQRLWPDGTVVDFDRGLNAAVTRLRQALSDSAESPRYVETVARRGYRFVGPVDQGAGRPEPAVAHADSRGGSSVSGWAPRWTRVWLAGIPIVLIATAAGWRVWSPRTNHEFGVTAKGTMLTGASGAERSTSFSRDGTQVVYEWEREDGEHHLYLKVIGSGDPIPLTAGPGSEYGPAWSRDGKWIAFLRQQQDSAGVYVIEPFGGTARKVADVQPFFFGLLRRPYRRLDWTADSRHIIVGAFGRPHGMESLLLISVDTGEKAWLTGPAGDMTMSGDREPAVSPDGTEVAFARGAMGNESLYILQLGAGLQPVGAPRPVPGAGPAQSPAWLPDGRQLIFTTLKPGMSDVFGLSWIDLDSRKPPRNLLSLGSNATMPAVSQQGRLAYSIAEGEGIIWRQDLPRNGETPPPAVKVNASAAFQMGAQYSPDGARIAFSWGRTGTREIWNCASDGLHCIQVTSWNATLEFPRWSPDGKRLLFQSMAEGDWGAYMVDATGGAPRLLNPETRHALTPYWSHNGKWIYYSSRETGALQIQRIPAEGGKAVPITRNGGIMPVDSPDSKTLYYLKAERGTEDLFRSAADGDGETELVRAIEFRGFAVAADRVYYLHKPGIGPIEIREFILATRSDSHVVTIDRAITAGLGLSPDGKSLLFSEWRNRGSLMLVDNLH
jgi:Tol biopolymer transport system component/DNA-binding winged helix-turn-helix (wHTH) protein